jgi:hypothetical protein
MPTTPLRHTNLSTHLTMMSRMIWPTIRLAFTTPTTCYVTSHLRCSHPSILTTRKWKCVKTSLLMTSCRAWNTNPSLPNAYSNPLNSSACVLECSQRALTSFISFGYVLLYSPTIYPHHCTLTFKLPHIHDLFYCGLACPRSASPPYSLPPTILPYLI